MKINNSALLVALSCISMTLGFTVQTTTTTMSRATSTSQLNALTHEDILKRARKAAGQEEEDEAPQIFDDSLLDDMRATLLILEKRVKEGPGSLSMGETEEFESMAARIISEHEDFVKNGGKSLDQGKSQKVTPLTTLPNAKPGGEAKPLVESLPAAKGPDVLVENDEEGDPYDGEGGMGLAKGTTNTWVIPGMDEMTGEEYRAALQESVSQRQSQRKAGEVTGNRSSNNYLENL